MRRIGVLLFAAEDRAAINPFLSGLEALGYIDGKTVAIAYREAAGNYERAPDLANELGTAQSRRNLFVWRRSGPRHQERDRNHPNHSGREQ
jgi:hypothetical protein